MLEKGRGSADIGLHRETERPVGRKAVETAEGSDGLDLLVEFFPYALHDDNCLKGKQV